MTPPQATSNTEIPDSRYVRIAPESTLEQDTQRARLWDFIVALQRD